MIKVSLFVVALVLSVASLGIATSADVSAASAAAYPNKCGAGYKYVAAQSRKYNTTIMYAKDASKPSGMLCTIVWRTGAARGVKGATAIKFVQGGSKVSGKKFSDSGKYANYAGPIYSKYEPLTIRSVVYYKGKGHVVYTGIDF